MTEQEYLTQRLESQISWYSKKSTMNKWNNNITKGLVIMLAASITVITQIEFDNVVKNILLSIIGASIAVITGVSGILKFQEKWTKYRTTAETLKHEKYLFLTRTGPYENGVDALKVLVPRVESLISKENSLWGEFVSKPN